MDWRSIQTAPKEPLHLSRVFDKEGPAILLTDGNLFACGCYLVVGNKTYWRTIGCSAFHLSTDVYDYDGPLHFEPTHWMPLPEPPVIS